MILVFGSLNMDLALAMPALPGPGQTVLTRTYATAPGGKGANQAVAAARAGASVRMAGRVGRDPYGDILLEGLAAEGIDIGAVTECDEPTGIAVVCVDEAGENQISVASGANLKAAATQVPEDWLGRDTTLLLQLEVPYAECWALGRRARKEGARVILNAAPAGPVEPQAFDILIVNEGEATAVARAAGLKARGGMAAASALAAAWKKTVVVTLGRAGARAYAPKGALAVAALHVEPRDTTGAGDAFVGAFAAALDGGHDLAEALRWGSVGGALACLTQGAQPSMPTKDAIEERLADVPPPRCINMRGVKP